VFQVTVLVGLKSVKKILCQILKKSTKISRHVRTNIKIQNEEPCTNSSLLSFPRK
jgi:transcriptional regulator of met regulon